MTQERKILLKEYLMLIIGCFIFSLGAVILVEPYGFAPGGTYGLSMVAHHLWGWRTEITAICLDIPLLLLGTVVLGSKFGFKTLLGTLLLPFFMWLVHIIYGYGSIIEPGITDISLFENQMLASLFGGVFYGVGLGLVYKARATTGGSDVVCMILRKSLHISMGTAIIIVDGLITFSTVIAFGDWKLPMYSWVILAISSFMTDRIIDGAPSKTLYIISSDPEKQEKIRKYIIDDMSRGATLIPGVGLYQKRPRDIIYVVLPRKEMIQLRAKIAKIDPLAFVNVVDSSEILGEGFSSLSEHNNT